MQLSEITKTIVNVATLVVSVGTLVLHETSGFLPGNVAAIVSVVIGVAGIVVHYLAPNTTTDPQVAKTQSVRLKAAPRKKVIRPRPATPHTPHPPKAAPPAED